VTRLANFRRIGELLPLGRIFSDWANFLQLDEFSSIGRIFADWAKVYIGIFFKKNSLKNEVFVVVLGNNWGHRLDFLARKSFGHPGRTIEAGIA
jgi:hypothetical protein